LVEGHQLVEIAVVGIRPVDVGARAPKGKAGPKVDPSERVDVYFTGSSKPYRPKYGKVSKKDAAIIEQHIAQRTA
jgi:hypothetical protein